MTSTVIFKPFEFEAPNSVSDAENESRCILKSARVLAWSWTRTPLFNVGNVLDH